jgi:hypothetical protein
MKSKSSGHAKDFSWEPLLRHWAWSGRHPYLATLIGPLLPRNNVNQLRLATIKTHTRQYGIDGTGDEVGF